MSRSFRLGLFLLTTLAVLAVCVFLVGRQESKFGANYRIHSDFKNVAGLSEGADVRVGGIRKGTVRSIRLPKRPDEKVIVTMDLDKETQAIVKQDSVASIQSEGLLGDKYVEISFGSMDAPRLKGGETIESTPPLDIGDLFHKADQMLDTGQSTLNNIDQITAKVNTGQGTAGKLINDTTLYKQAAAGATSLHEDADALQHNFLLRGFFKNQGYSNPDEIKQHEIPQLPKEHPIKTFEYNAKDLFDKPDGAKLKNEKNDKNLDAAGQFLQSQKFGLAVVVASTGRKGDTDQERVLSEARGYVVRKYLVDNFQLDDKRMKTMGLGKTADSNAEGSVQILIYATAPATTPASAPTVPPANPPTGPPSGQPNGAAQKPSAKD
jgi:phospholipid/cholesterol/gamma-HCH transport system substrate-binding protein